MPTEPSPQALETPAAEPNLCGEIQPYWDGSYFCELANGHEGMHVCYFPIEAVGATGYCAWESIGV